MLFVASPFTPDSGFSSPSCSKSISLPCFSCGQSSRAFRPLPFSTRLPTVHKSTQTDFDHSFGPRTAQFIADRLCEMGDRFEREFMTPADEQDSEQSLLDQFAAWISQLWC